MSGSVELIARNAHAGVPAMRMAPYFLQLLGLFLVAIGLIAWMPFFSSDMRLDLVGVIFMEVLGGILFLIGYWLDRMLGPPKVKTIAAPTPGDTRFIVKMLTRERRRYLIFGPALLAFDALILFAERMDDGTGGPAHPVFALDLFVIILMTLVELLMLILGVASLARVMKLWKLEDTEIYKVLTATPHKVTGLTRHLYQSNLHVGNRGRQLMVELEVQDKNFRLGVTDEQFVALKQYIKTHNPKARYSEEEHET